MTVALQPIASLWASYRAEVLPADASETHIREAKLAFYAGFHTCFWMFTLNPSDAIMKKWNEELNLFVEQAKGGLV